MQKFIMLSGIPGSGKTTTARDMSKNPNMVWIYSDGIGQLRFKGKKCNRYDIELFIILKHDAIKAFKKGKDVVYDATNLTPERRKLWLSIVPKDVKKICIEFKVPVETCIERDKHRNHVVGEESIRHMAEIYIPPTYDEGWDEIINYSNKEKL